jgi:group II intron reverse transcriptase/maturase
MHKKWYSLYDKVYSMANLKKSFTQVKRNGGASGVDGQSISDFGGNLSIELSHLQDELVGKTYQPQAVKRVYIDKPDGSQRALGIPTVRDRVVQQCLLNVLQPIFAPDFHPSSYGYRPKRSAAHAVAKAERFVNHYGLAHVVDMDLSKCFDTLDHELILQGVNRKVSDGSVHDLIGKMLKSGLIEEGQYYRTDKGCPQGGVISPLLMNIYLDSSDQHMKELGIRIVRYADDILILARTRSEAGKYRSLASQYLEGELLLKVNETKTQLTDNSQGISFLGFIISNRGVRIDPKNLKRFRNKVRQLSRRNSGKPVILLIGELNQLLRGFANYFRIGQVKKHYEVLMSWIRRRLRMCKMREWKSWNGLHKQLRRMGYQGRFEKISMRRWRNTNCHLIHRALPKEWFTAQGLYDMTRVKTNILHQYYE